jgi:hypothetical protein
MADADREIAKRLLQYRHLFDGELKKAEELEAHAQNIRALIAVQKARVDQGLPSPDACADCWVQRGKNVMVVPRVSPGHDKLDRWGCPNCGWHFDVLTR